jgi:glycosyl transferase family 87
VALFGLAPIAVIATMFVVGLDSRPLSHDFHFELYPEAKELLAGRNPFPGDDFDPASPPNLIWPPVAAYLVAPLTLFPRDTADLLMACLGLLCFAASLRVVGVRDWRVYGAFALWPQVAGEMRLSHLTPQLCLLSALAWRSRRRLIVPGALVGFAVALKLFVWPLFVWLLAIRRPVAAGVSVLVAGASLLLVLPFTGLGDYVGALLELGRAFDQDSYTIGGMALQLGLPEAAARGVTIVCGTALLFAAWRNRSFALAIATALTVSPIIWLDYYAVAGIPLAIARPRVSLVWLLPVLTWGLHGAGLGIGSTTNTLRLLIVFAVVFAVSVRDEPTDDDVASEPLRRVRSVAHTPSPQ